MELSLSSSQSCSCGSTVRSTPFVGGDETVARAWLRNDNTALRGKPLETIQTVPGLVDAIAYLDARRAIV